MEIWIHSASFSALVSPRRGGVLEEYTVFEPGINYADVLTRRREAYHEPARTEPGAASAQGGGAADGTPSIHDLEHASRLERLPPVDAANRALFVDRVLSGQITLSAYSAGEFGAVASWAEAAFAATLESSPQAVELVLRPVSGAMPAGLLAKRPRCEQSGDLTVRLPRGPGAVPSGPVFFPR